MPIRRTRAPKAVAETEANPQHASSDTNNSHAGPSRLHSVSSSVESTYTSAAASSSRPCIASPEPIQPIPSPPLQSTSHPSPLPKTRASRAPSILSTSSSRFTAPRSLRHLLPSSSGPGPGPASASGHGSSRKASNPHLSLIYASATGTPSAINPGSSSKNDLDHMGLLSAGEGGRSGVTSPGAARGRGSVGDRNSSSSNNSGGDNNRDGVSRTSSRSEEALSRQLDADLGGRQMGLRSRRSSSSATVQTVRAARDKALVNGGGTGSGKDDGNGHGTGTGNGNGSEEPVGPGRAGSANSGIQEDLEEGQTTWKGSGGASTSGSRVQRNGSEKGEGEATAAGAGIGSGSAMESDFDTLNSRATSPKTGLNPKSSTSWLRWNAAVPTFPKADPDPEAEERKGKDKGKRKGKEKERAETETETGAGKQKSRLEDEAERARGNLESAGPKASDRITSKGPRETHNTNSPYDDSVDYRAGNRDTRDSLADAKTAGDTSAGTVLTRAKAGGLLSPDTTDSTVSAAASSLSSPTPNRRRGWFSRGVVIEEPIKRVREAKLSTVDTSDASSVKSAEVKEEPSTSSQREATPVVVSDESESAFSSAAFATTAPESTATSKPSGEQPPVGARPGADEEDSGLAGSDNGNDVSTGWKGYLTWGRAGPKRTAESPRLSSEADRKSVATFDSAASEETTPVTGTDSDRATETTGTADTRRVSAPMEAESNSSELMEPALESANASIPPVGATAVSTDDTSVSVQQAKAGWGSFLYSIVIPQVGPPSSQTGHTIVAPPPDTEQPPVPHTTAPSAVTDATPTIMPGLSQSPKDLQGRTSAQDDSQSPETETEAEIENQTSTATSAPPDRKGSQPSSSGWLSYLVFRASQKKITTGGASMITSGTDEPRKSGESTEVMDFSNDSDFPAAPITVPAGVAPSTSGDNKAGSSSVGASGGGRPVKMNPPQNGPIRKRLSNSSGKSGNVVAPIPSSPKACPMIEPSQPQKGSSALPNPPAVPSVQPNLVLPTFANIFDRPPRSLIPLEEEKSQKAVSSSGSASTASASGTTGLAWRALGAVGSYVYGGNAGSAPVNGAGENDHVKNGDSESRGQKEGRGIGDDLPRRIGLVGGDPDAGWKGVKRVVVVGVHGWFPAKMLNSVIGEPTGTSAKFANMMHDAVKKFFAERDVKDVQITLMPLEGDGIIDHRVDKLFKAYLSNPAWIHHLRMADAIFFAAHSQGCIATTHLISRLIAQGHIRTPYNTEAASRCEHYFGPPAIVPAAEPALRPLVPTRSSSSSRGQVHATTVPTALTGAEGGYQRVCMLAMCGVHLGPLYSINTSTVIQPYLQWFENAAARELFEFQESTSAVSVAYQRALAMCLQNDVKVVLLSSMNDQVVPIYGSSFSTASHPLLLRALFVDGPSHNPATEYMTNLLAFAFMLRNAGISDQRLIEHLSEATAGSLIGLGHSSPYEEPQVYSLAVDYLFLAGHSGRGKGLSRTSREGYSNSSTDLDSQPIAMELEQFSAREPRNDFELPWIMRALVDAPEVKDLFPQELKELKEGVVGWKPVTKALKDIKKRLEPMAGRQSRLKELAHSASAASLKGEAGGSTSGLGSSPSAKSQVIAGLRRDW